MARWAKKLPELMHVLQKSFERLRAEIPHRIQAVGAFRTEVAMGP